MSSLHHEELLEDCYEKAYERFKTSNKLTEDMMQELLLHSGVQFAIKCMKFFGICNTSIRAKFI